VKNSWITPSICISGISTVMCIIQFKKEFALSSRQKKNAINRLKEIQRGKKGD
jgi:hypothetical protein